MTRRLIEGTAAALILLAGNATMSAQAEPALSTLTVPPTILPAGCQMAPVPPLPSPYVISDGTQIKRPPFPGKFPANPWQGTEDRYKTQVQDAIDPPRPVGKLPDAIPLDPKVVNKMRWAGRGIVAEAYHATYAETTGASVVVQAVRFQDPQFAIADPKQPTRIVRGPVVINVAADQPTGCMNAVLSYIQSLK